MKKKAEEPKKEPKEDVKNLLLHLESEYRKANISEKNYKELKGKYNKMLKGDSKVERKKEEASEKEEVIEEDETETSGENEEVEPKEVEEHLKKVEEVVEKEMSEEPKKEEKRGGFFKSIFGKKKESESIEQPAQETEQPTTDDPPTKDKKSKEKEEEITEITPEVIERLAQQVKEQAEGQTKEGKEDSKEKKSGGLLKSIFGKKEEAKPLPEASAESVLESSGAEKNKTNGTDYSVEIEKLKIMIDTVRESGKVTDETARGLSESIGELRSMVFQADAELKEVSMKMEKIEDEISEVRPQEIQKKFREYNENFEKNQLELEKLSKKAEDSGEKINKVFELLKSIGGIENLININQQVQKKLEEINEVMKYIERIGTKTEKMFIDLNKGLQDLILIKAKQDDFNESLKDIIKNIDSLNVKFEGYITKKDIDAFKEDNMLIKKQIEDIKKVLPIADLKLPENIINLRKEREDINSLLESLEEQCVRGKVSKDEFAKIKDANTKRLEEIRTSLESEWKNIGDLIKPAEKEEPEEAEPAKMKEEKPKKKVEEAAKEEVQEEIVEEKVEKKPESPKKIEEMPKEKIIEIKKPTKKLKMKIVKKKEAPKKVVKEKEKPKAEPKKELKPKVSKPKSESQRKAEILSSLKKLH